MLRKYMLYTVSLIVIICNFSVPKSYPDCYFLHPEDTIDTYFIRSKKWCMRISSDLDVLKSPSPPKCFFLIL